MPWSPLQRVLPNCPPAVLWVRSSAPLDGLVCRRITTSASLNADRPPVQALAIPLTVSHVFRSSLLPSPALHILPRHCTVRASTLPPQINRFHQVSTIHPFLPAACEGAPPLPRFFLPHFTTVQCHALSVILRQESAGHALLAVAATAGTAQGGSRCQSKGMKLRGRRTQAAAQHIDFCL